MMPIHVHRRIAIPTLRMAWGLLLTKYHTPDQLELYVSRGSDTPLWSCKRSDEAAVSGACIGITMAGLDKATAHDWLHRVHRDAANASYELVLVQSPERCSPAWQRELEQIVQDDARWNRHLHDGISKDRFKDHLANLEEVLIHCRDLPLRHIAMMSGTEYRQIVETFNDTTREYPRDQTIGERLTTLAAAHPDRVAVLSNTEALTYRELDAKSTQLAVSLRERGVTPGDRVAITADRTLEMLIGLFAILKAGAAYVPLDPRAPESHNRLIVSDCGIRLVLSRTAFLEVETLNSYDPASYAEWKEQGSLAEVAPGDLAYVIYTSGTTGTPKGVMIRHRGVVNYASFFNAQYGIDKGLRVLLAANLTFDASVEAIFCTLLNGGTVVLISAELLVHPRAFRQYISKHRVQVLPLVPTLLKGLLMEGERLACVEAVITGGEALDARIKETLLQKGYRVYNHYGPTETSVVALTAEMKEGKTVTIGRPVANVRVYILNAWLEPCPIGVIGEICIAGDGVAAGYLNRDEQTRQRFVVNPWVAGTLMYRTGDLGRWSAEGEVEYAGRMDDQLKINGVLVHPEAIRTAIAGHPAIQDAMVLKLPGIDGKLAAFYSTPKASSLSVNELRKYLLHVLPPAQIPGKFVEVREFPLNSSGKVDKKALLAVVAGEEEM